MLQANATLLQAIKSLIDCNRITVAEYNWLGTILDNPAKWSFDDVRRLEALYCKQFSEQRPRGT